MTMLHRGYLRIWLVLSIAWMLVAIPWWREELSWLFGMPPLCSQKQLDGSTRWFDCGPPEYLYAGLLWVFGAPLFGYVILRYGARLIGWIRAGFARPYGD